MSDFSIDDMNTTLIQYNGLWQGGNGSTRQWDGTAHTTGQAGATATFQFSGYILRVWGTVAGGVGKNLVQLTIDGGPPNITSQKSNGSAIFNVVYFETPLLSEAFHTAVITNLGSTTNGSSEFQLDRFEFITTDVTPLFAPPTGSTSQSVSATSSATPSATVNITKSSSLKSPLAAIAGGVIGALTLVIILLLFLLWRRRKRSGASDPTPQVSSLPTPFPLNDSPTLTSNGSQPSRLNLGKAEFHPESNLSPNPPCISISPSSGSQLPVLTIDTSGSNSQPPTRQIASTSYNETPSEFIQRDDPSLRYPSFTDHASVIQSSSLSSSVNMYDNPPPSYWHLKQNNDVQSGHTISGAIQPF